MNRRTKWDKKKSFQQSGCKGKLGKMIEGEDEPSEQTKKGVGESI